MLETEYRTHCPNDIVYDSVVNREFQNRNLYTENINSLT